MEKRKMLNRLKERYTNSISSLKSRNPVSIVAMLLCALLLTFLSAPVITKVVYQNAKTETVTFTTYGTANGVPLQLVDNHLYFSKDDRLINDLNLDLNSEKINEKQKELLRTKDQKENQKSLFSWANNKNYIYNSVQMKNAVTFQEGFAVRDTNTANKNWIRFIAQSPNETISFELPIYPTTCVSVEKNGTGMSLAILRDSNPEGDWISSSSFAKQDNQYSQKLYFYDLEDYAYIFIYYAIAYTFIFIASMIGILLTARACKWYFKKFRFMSGYHPWRMFFLIFICLFLYMVFTYTANPNAFHISGAADAYYYAYPERQVAFLDSEGAFSWNLFFQNCWAHRSYLPLAIYFGLNLVAKTLAFDPIYLHLALNALFVTLASVVAAPILYQVTTKQKLRDDQILLFAGLYFVFWRAHLFFALTDLPGATMALIAFGQGILLVTKVKPRNAILFGVTSAIAIAYRASYLIMFKLGMIAIAFYFLLKLFKNKNKKFSKRLAQFAIGTILPVLMIVLVMWPQGYINMRKGHVGLLPYYSSGVYNTSKNDLGKSQWGSLNGYKFGGPYNADEQLNQVMEAYVTDDLIFAQADIPFVVATSPLPLLAGMLKRTFYALSAYQEPLYKYLCVNRSQIADTLQYLLNYFLLGNVIYYGFIRKNHQLGWKLKSILEFCFVFQVLAQVGLFHIEQRFFMLFFMLVYLINVFCIPHCWAEDLCWAESGERKTRQWKYLSFIAAFTLLCYIAITTINSNFA